MSFRRWRGIVVVAVLALGAGLWASRAYSSSRVPVAEALVVDYAYEERADTIARNETLSEVFGRQGIVGADLLALLRAAPEIKPRRISAGTTFEFRLPVEADRASRVRVRIADSLFLNVMRSAGGWRVEREEITWTVHTERVTGAVASSIYETMDEAISDSILPTGERSILVWNLADVYQWQIDFTRDNYPGDDFVILFERLVSSLGEVRFGRILAAEVESRGRPNLGYVLSTARGQNAYYDERGRSLRRAFKLYPVEFRRISSGFSRRRLHPVLGIYRAHLGIDYAASPGTPIQATGNGIVTRASRWGGYGLVVTIRHPNGIETRYAHMSRIAPGIRPGTRVEQDQWIGNVGSSGLARGPHVHYEFLRNGRHVDPRGVDLGDGEPVPSARRSEFDSLRTYYDRFLGRAPVPVDVD